MNCVQPQPYVPMPHCNSVIALKQLRTHKRAILLHWVTHSFIAMGTVGVVNSETDLWWTRQSVLVGHGLMNELAVAVTY